jgi:hypothetical protein
MTFYGRDMSNSIWPVPAMTEYGSQHSRRLFVQSTQGLRDMGFGPGISIHPLVIPEYERAVDYVQQLNFTPDPIVVIRRF